MLAWNSVPLPDDMQLRVGPADRLLQPDGALAGENGDDDCEEPTTDEGSTVTRSHPGGASRFPLSIEVGHSVEWAKEPRSAHRSRLSETCAHMAVSLTFTFRM